MRRVAILPRAAAVCLLGASLLACRPQRFEPRPGAPVILISIDTLRADHLPAWGYRGVETPAIDSLARDGIVFEEAWAQAPMTLPSHVSLLTGLLPPDNGVRSNLGYVFDPKATPSI